MSPSSSEEVNRSDFAMQYGLPARPPTASTTLWTHLLRSNTNQVPKSLKDMPIIAPPMVPLDKNASSMRILLHDTQANFEKFTTHVGTLFESIQETKNELKTTYSLFERDRETLMGDIIDLVNRSQKEIQKSVGTPAQTTTVEKIFKDVDHRLQGLDQRLEAIQAFNQTHSQGLQTQIQAIQMLLDKQGSILTAVLPLLPLIQAIPLHIDAAKNALTKRIEDQPTSAIHSFVAASSSGESNVLLEKVIRKRKRTGQSSLHGSSPSPDNDVDSPLAKKNRVELSLSDSNTCKISSTKLLSGDKLPLFARQPSATTSLPPLINFRANEITNGVASHTGVSPGADGVLRPNTSSSSGSGGPDSRRHGSSIVSLNLTTPRRPLADLPLNTALLRSSSRQTQNLNHRTPSTSTAGTGGFHTIQGGGLGRSSTVAASHTKQQHSFAPVFLGITPTAARPPRMLRMHASIASTVKLDETVDQTAAQQDGALSFDSGPLASLDGTKPASRDVIAGSSFLDPKAPLERPVLRAQAGRQVLIPPSVAQVPASISDEGKGGVRCMTRASTVTARTPSVVPSPIRTAAKKSPLSTILGKMKGRRTPVKEARRFIPLVDSDEEDDNDDA